MTWMPSLQLQFRYGCEFRFQFSGGRRNKIDRFAAGRDLGGRRKGINRLVVGRDLGGSRKGINRLAAAAVVMALNKQTINFVVATIGTTPIKVPVSAKFYHTPAFIFFVIANGMCSFHNLVMIGVDIFLSKFDYKGLRLPIIAILDMMTASLVSGGVNGALFMAELGKNGNSHARWDKICDKFGTFCNHGAGALIASFIALLLLLIISVISILNILKSSRPTSTSSASNHTPI